MVILHVEIRELYIKQLRIGKFQHVLRAYMFKWDMQTRLVVSISAKSPTEGAIMVLATTDWQTTATLAMVKMTMFLVNSLLFKALRFYSVCSFILHIGVSADATLQIIRKRLRNESNDCYFLFGTSVQIWNSLKVLCEIFCYIFLPVALGPECTLATLLYIVSP